MKNSTKVGIIVCLTIVLAFSLSVAFAGNEKTNVTKNMTNVTKNVTNVTKNMTNATNPFAKAKGVVVVKRDVLLNNTTNPLNETKAVVVVKR
jgi:hypothetical protein